MVASVQIHLVFFYTKCVLIYFIFSQHKIKKKTIKSLPTRDEPCIAVNYGTCITNVISLKISQLYNCSVPFITFLHPFMIKKSKLNICSHDITLQSIKEWKYALQKETYENCEDFKPCNYVEFSIEEKRPSQYGATSWGPLVLNHL